eukprot:5125412-Pyramimonas_sp.AAC.1
MTVARPARPSRSFGGSWALGLRRGRRSVARALAAAALPGMTRQTKTKQKVTSSLSSLRRALVQEALLSAGAMACLVKGLETLDPEALADPMSLVSRL